ncbi:MAG: hypothetical protein IH591_01570 [Bacteroidales bacterium]|nr:hypothetical protein [Bacteroidales bacterium]
MILPSIPWYGYVVLFIVCAVIVRITLAFFNSFQPEYIQTINRMISKRGIVYILITTTLITVITFIDLILSDGSAIYYAFLLPVGIVSITTLFVNDYLPASYIQDDDNLLTPPAPDDDEGTPDEQEKPEEPGDDKLVSPEPGFVEESDIPEDDEEIIFEKVYKWKFEGVNYRIELPIRPALYDKFRLQKRVDSLYWADEYVTKGICGEVRLLAQKLLQSGKLQNSYNEVAFVLAFTQSIVTYHKDPENDPRSILNGEYPKYPIETLAEEKGDCEDSAILGASILKTMGYDSALIFLPGHCALGIAGTDDMPGSYIEHDQKKYFYCETTASGWKIGELPEDYENTSVSVYPINSPAISFAD